MKQHELLRELCKEIPHGFTITFSLRDKKVIISSNNSNWIKYYDYEVFMSKALKVLSKEILSEHSSAKNIPKQKFRNTPIPQN